MGNAQAILADAVMLDAAMMEALFPDAQILREKLGPLTKSLLAIRTQGSGKSSSLSITAPAAGKQTDNLSV